jgi:hypothetical protein
MGRTTPTYRTFLDGFREEWQPFRRALRRSDRPAFDRVFEKAHRHADAAGQRNPPDPQIAVLLSVLVAQERELAALRAAVDGVESPADGPHATPSADADHSG